MTTRIGILIFDDAEELDFVGPWEVFTMVNEVRAMGGREAPHDVKLIAEAMAPVRCAKGMRVVPDLTIAQCERLEVLLIPGGIGTRREAKNEAMLSWIRNVAAHCQWVTSVCTGALLLTAAGNIVTAAGVSAGIDMALWLVGQLHDPVLARHVQRAMQYDPAPPYAAEV
jgi:transcriptional regulator GlxA family with amidase domain